MRIITINLPEKYLDALKVLTDNRIYPSRSEEIRVALKDFLEDELEFASVLEYNKFKKIMKEGV